MRSNTRMLVDHARFETMGCNTQVPAGAVVLRVDLQHVVQTAHANEPMRFRDIGCKQGQAHWQKPVEPIRVKKAIFERPARFKAKGFLFMLIAMDAF